jgi:hypothetical protein
MDSNNQRMNRFIISQRAMGHDQERLEEAVADFLDGLELSVKSISNSDEIMVKGIGKTVAQSQKEQTPKKEEKELPGIKNEDGWRYDPSAKGGPGMELRLFPPMNVREGLDKHANFGWVEEPTPPTANTFKESIQQLMKEPRVTLDVYEVDKDGEPTRKLSEREVAEQNAESVKSIGRSIRQMNPAGGLAQRAAKQFKVVVDDLGKFRCPPGTPQANQFTDKFGSTCFAISAAQIREIAQRGLDSLSDWWGHQRATGFGSRFIRDRSGSSLTSANRYREKLERPKARWLKNARTRGRARMVEMEDAVDNLVSELGIEVTPEQRAQNEHLFLAFAKLKEMGLWDIDLSNQSLDFKSQFATLSEEELEAAKELGFTPETALAVERGVLTRLLETYLRDPHVAKEISVIRFSGFLAKDPKKHPLGEREEAMAHPLGGSKLADTKFAINFDIQKMTLNAASQVPEVKKGQRLGINVTGARTEEERAAAIADFVASQEMFAGGMAAAIAVDGRKGKGVHTAAHEIGHVIQMMQWKKLMLAKYSNKELNEMTSGQIVDSMKDLNDGIDFTDLGVTRESMEAVAILGGKYPLDLYREEGMSQLWAIELSAELYALRDMGILEGDDIDSALEWMDRTAKAKDATHRANTRKRQMALVAKEMSKPLMDGDRPDYPLDPEDGGKPPTPRKAPRVFTSKKDSDDFGKSTRRKQIAKLNEQEGGAIERIGNPTTTRVASLLDGDPTQEILAIHRDHKRLRRIGELPDKFDIHEGSVAEQIEHTLIPTLTALEKSKLPSNIVVRFQPKSTANPGEMLSIPELKSFQLEHDELGLPPGTIAIELGPDASGIFVPSDPFDSSIDEAGKFGRVMLPPGRIFITGTDADGRITARLVDQESSSESLQRMIDNWPTKGDSKFEDGILRREKSAAQKLVDNHNEKIRAGGGEVLPDGRSGPILAREIRRNNEDIVDKLRRSGGRPTRPDREYVDGLASTSDASSAGFDDAFGLASTPIERRIDRDNVLNQVIGDISAGSFPDNPELAEMVSSMTPEEIKEQLEGVVFDIHDSIDRRPRLRMNELDIDSMMDMSFPRVQPIDGSGNPDRIRENRLRDLIESMPEFKLPETEKPSSSLTDLTPEQIQDALKGVEFEGKPGYYSFGQTGTPRKHEVEYQSRIGIHPDTPDSERPVSGYVVHKSQRDMTVNALKKKGIVAGDMPFEYESENTPMGNVGVDGDIEIILRPEVSGRTAYGFGRGSEQQTRPVWMNSDEPDDIMDALLHPTSDNYKTRFANAMIVSDDNDVASFMNSKRIKPSKLSENYDSELDSFHSDLSGQQPLGAHIMGGFKKDEISAVVHPWSKVQGASKDVDISDAIEQEPISEKLSRLGFSPEEIQYFYSLNGNSLGSINTSAMQQLRAFRKSQEVSDKYKKMGIPEVQFAHKHGLDMLAPSSYSLTNQDEGGVEDVLKARIQIEIDNELKAALKKIQKTRGELTEINL